MRTSPPGPALLFCALTMLACAPPPADLARGQVVYDQRCARCHVANPPVDPFYGRLAELGPPGRVWTDAGALHRTITQTMPKDRPGTLPEGDALAVTAWLLHKNALLPKGAPLPPETLAARRIDQVVILNYGAGPAPGATPPGR